MFEFNQPKKYWCAKCHWWTSGIIKPDSSLDITWCLKCQSPLLHCGKCGAFTSGTRTDDIVVCDSCHQITEVEIENQKQKAISL